MQICNMIENNRPFLSLEFFPPKEKEGWPEFFARVEKLKQLHPLFVSITCGAGGSSRDNTLEIASRLQNEMGLETMAHLTCLGGDRASMKETLTQLQGMGVSNILALRGDPSRDPDAPPPPKDFCYASDLVTYVRENFPEIGVGVAGYPEAHPESPSIASDRQRMKEKLECGTDILVTQFLFDSRLYFDYVERLRELGVTQPIIPGVLPVLSLKSVRHILSLSGASIPGRLYLDLEEANERGGPEEVRRLGIEFARKQIRELLAGGAPGIHLYTLNQAEPCLQIAADLF